MDADWRTALRNLIIGYMSETDMETGLREAARVLVASQKHYEYYITALKAGIESASRGETDVIDVLKPAWRDKDPAEARVSLEEMLAKFQAIYAEAVEAYENKQRMKREEEK